MMLYFTGVGARITARTRIFGSGDHPARSMMLMATLGIAALTGCGDTLNPSFTADINSGSPGTTVNFTNTSSVGFAAKEAESQRVVSKTPAQALPDPETKAPQRTIPRPPTPQQRLVATFFLNTQREVPVGAAITATNQTIGAETSEWEVTGPGGAQVFPPVGNPGMGLTRDLPAVELPQAGAYTVSLTVTDTDFNVTDRVSASVQATDGNTGNVTEENAVYTWDFGDGSAPQEIGLDEPVQHTYTDVGSYTVSLTMERDGTAVTETVENFIGIFAPPTAMQFDAQRMAAAAPNTFMFTDESTENPNDPIVSWVWDFGDGQSQTTDNPNVTHQYTTPGTYTVTLTTVTQNGGESTATRTDIVQVLAVDASGGGGTFDVANYLPLEVGNRWVYRSTGSTSFLPFHFALSVVAATTQTTAGGTDITVYTLAVKDSLDRNSVPASEAAPLSGGFLIARVEGALYAFRDEASLNFFLDSGTLEPFFSFPLANTDLQPGTRALFDPAQQDLSATYTQDALFDILPDLLTEADYRALIDGASSTSKSANAARGLVQPRSNAVTKFSGAPKSDADENPVIDPAKQTAAGIDPASVGVGDQADSIAMNIDGQIPYVFSNGLGITYLVGSALTDFFPIATVGPGSEFFTIDSTFTLEYAIVDGVIYGNDDHNDNDDPFEIFDQRGTAALDPDIYPTVLISNFGQIPGHLSGEDVDVFYLLTSTTEGGVDYSLDINVLSGGPVAVELHEIDENYTTLLNADLDPDNFRQSFPFSEFLVKIHNANETGETEYTVELLVEAGDDDHADDTVGATPILLDATLNGTLEVIGDLDVFAFDAQAGMTYTIETSNASFTETDTFLTLLDAEGRDIGIDDDDSGFGLFSQVEFTPAESGLYHAVVTGFNNVAVGPYTITVLPGAATDAEADDHANSILEATQLTVDAIPTRGNLEQFGDFDDFVFNAVAGQAYVVETASGSNTDTYLFVFDQDYVSNTGNQTFFFNDDGGAGFTSRIVFIAAETEPVFVEVQGFQNQVAGRYTVGVNAIDINDDHGNSALDATPFSGTIEGALDISGDVDAFTFDATAGSSYIFATSGATRTDTVLQVFDADGNLLAENDDAGATIFSTVFVTPAATGPLTILVSGFANSQAGPYTLSVVQDDHGNNIPTATPIAIDNDPLNGTIEAFGDFDWFSFDIALGETYTIQTGPQDGSVFDTELFLLDIDGNLLEVNDDGPDIFPFSQIIWFADRNETLFAAVAGLNDNVIGDYSISVLSGVNVIDDHGNDLGSASPVTALNAGQTGEIEFGNDFDFFSFDATAGNHYSLDTFPANFDAYLEVFDAAGNSLAANDNTFDNAPYIFFTAPQSTTYFVAVAGATGLDMGEYTLIVRNDDFADNLAGGTPYLIDSAPLGASLEQTDVPGFPDYDVFEIQVDAGVMYRAETLQPVGSTLPETDTLLAVFDDTGQEIAFNDDRPGCIACTSEVVFSTTYTGTAQVRIEPFIDDSGLVASGPYELLVTRAQVAPRTANTGGGLRETAAAK